MASEDPTSGSCPQCGEALRRWPTIDGSGYVVACTHCDFERVVGQPAPEQGEEPEPVERSEQPSPESSEASHEETAARFREILSQGSEPSEGEWPDSLLADLPDDARQLLANKKKGNPAESSGDGTFRSDFERRLKEHGYYLAEDGHGPRLTGEGPRPGTGDLSPLDVVRLAADLEGGIPSPDERTKCPKCDAVVASSESHCPWCGHEMDQPVDPE